MFLAQLHFVRSPGVLFFSALLFLFSSAQAAVPQETRIALGERLFLETRFAEYFARHSSGDINPPESARPVDPSLASVPSWDGSWIQGPLHQATMSCAGCHWIDQTDQTPGGGPRAYTDFAKRSLIPAREDGAQFTPRNSPTIIEVLQKEDSQGRSFTHFDGEFASIQELVIAGLLGRNMGWLPHERDQAMRHITRVIWEDRGEVSNEDPIYRRSYREWFEEEKNQNGGRRRRKPSSDQVLNWIADLMGDYMRSLEFKRDERGEHDGSPYDAFLKINGLPRKPWAQETDRAYSKRLAQAIEELDSPKWVAPARFSRHDQEFRFGPEEFEGMRLFFRTQSNPSVLKAGVGNCVTCHTPPTFTDFSFHAIGIADRSYDAVHGPGAFRRLDLSARPDGTAPWVSASFPDVQNPERFDAGVWHVLANPKPLPSQELLKTLLCEMSSFAVVFGFQGCSDTEILERSIGRFKTPTVRNLGHTEPYFHDGSSSQLFDTVLFYMQASNQARAGRIRNADPEMTNITLRGFEVRPVVSFLHALNEDYD
jgi:cytochrome c peroxidase